jgi:hypothetical protein
MNFLLNSSGFKPIASIHLYPSREKFGQLNLAHAVVGPNCDLESTRHLHEAVR